MSGHRGAEVGLNACTVVVTATGGRCGQAAAVRFVTSRGAVYYECRDHAATPVRGLARLDDHQAPAQHPPTRTRRPYVLVRDGAIVGYADAVTVAVEARAARLGARIVKVQR